MRHCSILDPGFYEKLPMIGESRFTKQETDHDYDWALFTCHELFFLSNHASRIPLTTVIHSYTKKTKGVIPRKLYYVNSFTPVVFMVSSLFIKLLKWEMGCPRKQKWRSTFDNSFGDPFGVLTPLWTWISFCYEFDCVDEWEVGCL